MKNKKRIIMFLIFILMIMISFSSKVDALCTTKRYSDLKMIAYKSEVSYDLKYDDNHNYYFLLTLNNVDENILVKYNGYMYEPKDGVVVIPNKIYGGQTYEINLYGGYNTYCVEEYLYTKRITVPKYNIYSERDECLEYEEFYLCNKWYAGNIANETDFLNQLNVYIKSLEKPNDEIIPKKDNSIIQKIIDFYLEYKIVTIPITIVIVLFIVYKITVRIIRRRNRIKLNDR